MKTPALLVFIALATCTCYAGEAGDFLNHPGKLIDQPDFKKMPEKPWQIAKGKWEAKDGVLTPTPIESEKHVPVLWDVISPKSAVIECEFQLDAAPVFIIGCDGTKHIGRVSIAPKSARITDDSTENKKEKKAATLLKEEKLDLKKDQWYSAKFGWKGDKVYAIVDGKELVGQAPLFTTPRSRWWFATASAHIRNVKVSEGAP
jgi:hypothetical protein